MDQTESELPRILVLEDEEVVLLAIKEALRGEKCAVTGFTSARAALAAVDKESYSVIISDQRMPEMSGLAFLSECRKRQPHASRILITGALTLNTVIDAINKGEIFRFIAKPWIREELVATIGNGIRRSASFEQNERLRQDVLALNQQLLAANRKLEEKVG